MARKETAQNLLHLEQGSLCVFAGCLTAADAALVSAAVADLGSGFPADLRTVQMLAIVVEAHLLHHQTRRDLQEKHTMIRVNGSTMTSLLLYQLDWQRDQAEHKPSHLYKACRLQFLQQKHSPSPSLNASN